MNSNTPTHHQCLLLALGLATVYVLLMTACDYFSGTTSLAVRLWQGCFLLVFGSLISFLCRSFIVNPAWQKRYSQCANSIHGIIGIALCLTAIYWLCGASLRAIANKVVLTSSGIEKTAMQFGFFLTILFLHRSAAKRVEALIQIHSDTAAK